MNRYLKEFLKRGLMFGGFGPIIVAIVLFIVSKTSDAFSLGTADLLVAVCSSYALAFVHAGASVFNQIESWPLAKSMLIHFATLFASYVTVYLVNAWIPFNWIVIAVFSGIFVVTYFLIWIIVYLSLKSVSKRFNKQLKF